MKRTLGLILGLCLIATSAIAYWQSRLQVSAGSAPATLTWAIDPTNRTGAWNTATLALSCPSASCQVSASSSTQFGIGTASTNRIAIATFGYVGAANVANGQITGVVFNGTPSGASCTGGTAATLAADGYTNSSNAAGAAVWYAPVSTGTTVSVCFTAVGGNGWGGHGVVTVSYMNDSAGAGSASVSSIITASPPTYPGSCSAGSCINTSASLTVPPGGVGILVGITNDFTSPSSLWTGTASPTKQVETNDGVALTSPLATISTSGIVTETVVTTSLAGWSGAIFQP